MLYSDEIYIEDFKRTYTKAYRQGFIDGFNERGYLLTYIGNDHIENQNDHIVAEQTEPHTITMVKDHGRKQALEMINLYHKLKDEPQTEREGE